MSYQLYIDCMCIAYPHLYKLQLRIGLSSVGGSLGQLPTTIKLREVIKKQKERREPIVEKLQLLCDVQTY